MSRVVLEYTGVHFCFLCTHYPSKVAWTLTKYLCMRWSSWQMCTLFEEEHNTLYICDMLENKCLAFGWEGSGPLVFSHISRRGNCHSLIFVFTNDYVRISQQSRETEIKMIQSPSWFNMPHLHKVIQHHGQLRDIIYWNSLLFLNIFVLSLFQFFKLHGSLYKWIYSAPFCYLFMQHMIFSYLLRSSFIPCVFFTYPRWRLKILCGLYVQDHISTIIKAKIVSWKIKVWMHFYPHYLICF